MRKYYIGLLVLLVVTLGLTGYVLTLGMSAKTDVKTAKKATEIADKLNSFISAQQTIPSDLKAIGVNDAPSTISYKKDSSKEYTFCVTYKSAKSFGGIDPTSILFGMTAASLSSGSSSSSSDYKASSLYVSDYTHKKGKNCQTIQPYISNYNTNSSSMNMDIYCSPSGEYYSYYKDSTICTESSMSTN